MKILVLGAGGMAGHVIATHLKEKGNEVTTISANNKLNDDTILLDAIDQYEMNDFLTNNIFDIVINCIGVLVGQSDKRKDMASYLNSYLPHFLEQRYLNSETKIIHLSTDCVFSGKNPPYYENSEYDGDTFYDRSKALGEIINNKDLTFRMSIIGPDMHASGIGLFNWFYSQTGEIKGYKNAIWNGVTTIVLANAIEEAIKQDLKGLYHLTPVNNISKYNLLLVFKEVFERKDISILPVDNNPIDKTLINTRKDFKFSMPEYNQMIQDMKLWIEEHIDLYKQYI